MDLKNFGIVEHAQTHEFYACEFTPEPDAQGVYHIRRAAGPFPREEFVDAEGCLRGDDGDLAFQALAHWPDDHAARNEDHGRIGYDELGRWLDREPGDLW